MTVSDSALWRTRGFTCYCIGVTAIPSREDRLEVGPARAVGNLGDEDFRGTEGGVFEMVNPLRQPQAGGTTKDQRERRARGIRALSAKQTRLDQPHGR